MKSALLVVLLFAGIAHADPAAEKLFRDGQTLIAKGKIEEACDRFARSQQLEPAVGTLLNLGDCYERLGKTATAWDAFQRAVALATKLKDHRAVEGRRRATALESKLAYLTIEVGAERPTGFTLARNGEALDSALWNVGVPIDPGQYEIAASAPEHDSWSSTTKIASGKHEVVKVPPLVKRVAEMPPPEPTPPIVRPPPIATPVDTIAPVGRPRVRRWAIGASAGETSDFDPIFGARALRAIGNIRVLVSARYDKFGDDSTNGFSKSNQVLCGGGAELVWSRSRYAFAAGAMAGLDLLFRNQNRGTHAAAWWGVRASPILLRLSDGELELGLHLEGVQTTDRLAAFAVVGIDWFVR